MLRAYPALPLARLDADVGFREPEQSLPSRVSIDDPAVDVMTDLAHVSAVLARATDPIDDALQRMKQRGVRLLLVVNVERRVTGLITTTDILGERPMRHLSATGGRHEDIRVADVMTHRADLEAISMEVVSTSKVGHIVSTLSHTGRQHALAIEAGGRIRGIFSVTQIARQLGIDAQSINPLELARTFSEIEATLAR